MLSNYSFKKKFLRFIYFLIFFLLLFILNHMTYYVSDDYAYRFVYKSSMPTQPLEKINGFRSIFKSQVSHYHIWNGRFVAHSIVQFFMQFNKFYFNIFNSIAFLSLGIMIYLITNTVKNIRNSTSIFLLIFLLLWLLYLTLVKVFYGSLVLEIIYGWPLFILLFTIQFTKFSNQYFYNY